ncbi:tyrosine-type recombinase/integrase [Caballeronia sp. LZ062]|uniref:tyrosine-type recombinase/integrase n=1 Tax=unclassified Caballeronia TaxID=2646786 RepID=UPI00285AC99E|nr:MULTISPECIES: tyrosine-type recombinase/integrase [unclassified Caballeronia]MDR5857091.1 tyrosine-type recombinase/integrase [Caballeronia sp. LZ050]MDR5869513.1 tyrosine-type recombinase/integrase [Caballeronia sp. LZ062]
MPNTTDLFDQQRADWQADPHAAFDAWLAQQEFRASSADVYRAQWGNFLEWLQAKRATLHSVQRPVIEQFVSQLDIRRPQRMRYLRLIERVLDHVREIEAAGTNPARFIAQDGDASWRKARDNEPTGFLTHDERALLIAHLFSPLGALPAGQRWRERRDRALVAAFLGAGVKTGEAAQLTVDCYAPGAPYMTVDASNPLLIRQARLAPFAVELLDGWIGERKSAGLAGDLLFPAAPSGRSMHKATMLRAIDAVVAASGIAASRVARASPQTLRNTYAAELFDEGADPERVGQYLGFQQMISVHRLHRAWQEWMGEQIRERDIAQAQAGAGDEPGSTSISP